MKLIMILTMLGCNSSKTSPVETPAGQTVTTSNATVTTSDSTVTTSPTNTSTNSTNNIQNENSGNSTSKENDDRFGECETTEE